MQTRLPNKAHAFRNLKRLGLPVESVIDVGVLSCTADLMNAFPDVQHILVEPIEEFYEDIERIYQGVGIQYKLIRAAASDADGTATMKTSSIRESKKITHSRLTSEQGDGENFREVPTLTIETLVKQESIPKPFLLKIDVDGAELDVMRGALPVISNCSILCIEAGIQNFTERCNAAKTLGFELFDIVDLCYYDERFVQADFVFVNSQIIRNLKLDVYAEGFDVEKWEQFSPDDTSAATSKGGRILGRIKNLFGDS